MPKYNIMKILVTGCAGFVGFHLVKKLLPFKYYITGIDNLNDYYDRKLKKDRLNYLKKINHKSKFNFFKIDIQDSKKLEKIFNKNKFDIVINLAAQAGVRYSLVNPKSYVDNNILGFFNILNLSKKYNIKHLIFASTSSVYGNTKKFPIKETDNTSQPIQIYAASKKTNEVMAYSYSTLYNMKITGLRFFTVYGPWGRPDMALSIFTKSILDKKPIKLFNYGDHTRDFTYVDDIVSGIKNLLTNKGSSKKKFNIYNLGNSNPISLKNYVNLIEKKLNIKAKKTYLPLQKGDVKKTHSDTSLAKKDFNFKSKTPPDKGISEFINWYLGYYGRKQRKN